jgi:hypothetical protein
MIKRFARLFVVTLGLAILGLVVTLVPHKDANAQSPAQVQVVNTPLPVTVRGIAQGAPLQVTGGVTVANTPLPVSVSGIVDVVTPGRSSLRVAVASGTVGLASGSEVIMPTHLGVPVGNLVTLACLTSGTTCSSFRQVSSGGVQAATDYSIPPGETLIVTDLSWEATFGTAGHTIFLNLACTSACAFLHTSSVVADAGGIGSTTDHLTSGLDLVYLPTIIVANASNLSYLVLRGYLTP